MGKAKWSQNKSWNTAIEKEFFERLSKLKDPYDRIEKLYSQGLLLWEYDKNASLELFEVILNDYGDNYWVDYKNTLLKLGELLAKEKDYMNAEKYLRMIYFNQKVQASNQKSNTSNFADLSILRIVLETKQQGKYEEMYKVIKGIYIDSLFLKSIKFEFAYLAAWLCTEMNKKDEAKEYAQVAMNLLNDPKPSAPRHPGIGEIHPTTEERKLLYKILNNYD